MTEKILIAISILVIGLFAGFSGGKTYYENKCSKIIQEKEKTHTEALDNAKRSIQSLEGELSALATKPPIVIKEDLIRIRTVYRDKPSYIVVDGQCKLSPEFIETYNALINRANKE